MQTQFTYSFDENDLDGTERYYATRQEAYDAADLDHEEWCVERGTECERPVWISEIRLVNNDDNEIIQVWPVTVLYEDDGYPSYEEQVRQTYYAGCM